MSIAPSHVTQHLYYRTWTPVSTSHFLCRDSEENTKAVLKFLLQWFDSNSSVDDDYDPLLIDQLGCIVISRPKNDAVYTEVMKKFKEIIKEASQMVNAGRNVASKATYRDVTWQFL